MRFLYVVIFRCIIMYMWLWTLLDVVFVVVIVLVYYDLLTLMAYNLITV